MCSQQFGQKAFWINCCVHGAAVAPQRRSLTFKPGDADKPNMIQTSGFKEVKFEQNGDEMTLRFS
ncbi:MAG: hypothetical protein A3J05_01985 [Candidatus Doudnabacteria bacterium RIFCSPLOWO2_02_FULL_48_13]|uniref:Uncharacterized protein n=2 Tax=Bacteria candidate phyla TaxID=1783234 RepID=A0A1F5ER37_9BACT|nr:MAG: hypothetical protein A3D09_03860 [Candidatus Collierbacteria bacterium RIFCSPHIGHO2_02_FULL_49_10]OGE99856.1 MAG: hypothetical protein A3J05_01985 [Candidatus Doudnabacteria bacterium RIFCSPLOWO2_02_FULL_48_13]OGF00490.1 MAG: hypothetical protein A3G07_01885 [Candidatus Doudnabacteria bacterium RIFCSPLOWO2_12_FULL_47_12]